jgi:hypothetical protein
MAVLFMDGFDNNIAAGSGKYDSHTGSGNLNSAGRTGDAARWYNGFATKNFSSNYSTLVSGFAYKAGGSGINRKILKYIDDTTEQIYLYTNTSDQIQVMNGNGTTLGTSTTTISTSAFNYIEFKADISNTGSFTLKINGVTEASGSGVDTQNSPNSYANKVAIGSDSAYDYEHFDDYYIDSSDFQGTVKIYTIKPAANSSVNWTPSAGNNYECVDDAGLAHDDDSSYVSATAIGVTDTYTFAALGLSTGVIRAISHNFTAKKTDLNVTQMQGIINTSSTNATGSTQSLTQSYVCYQKIWQTNPYTGLGWTYGAIDTIIAGFQTV